MDSTHALKVDALTMRFGGLVAVEDFSLEMGATDLVGLIGPNGAGKTTIFNMITGMYVPSQGHVYLGKQEITGVRPANITQQGMARTFQNIRLFKDLTVLDNIRLAGHFRQKYGILSSIFHSPNFRAAEKELKKEALELLKIFKLEDKYMHLAKNLPYGEQRRLEIARALATKPKVLLLDEPAAGMNPNETKELTELIRWVRDHFQIAILLIEHDMSLVMDVCERIYVVDHGVEIAQGTPSEIQKNSKVIEAYLGTANEEGDKQ